MKDIRVESRKQKSNRKEKQTVVLTEKQVDSLESAFKEIGLAGQEVHRAVEKTRGKDEKTCQLLMDCFDRHVEAQRLISIALVGRRCGIEKGVELTP